MKIKLLKYPYPFKAWLVLSNDPDHTTIDRWDKLNEFIWNELKLPFSDSLFVNSYSDNVPDQVNLRKHGNKILGHYYDTMHTWGDYVYSSSKIFKREDAIESALLLKKYSIKPVVWVDHSSFVGNFIANNGVGAHKYLHDAAGYSYKNIAYSFDIAYGLGVRYLWDGNLAQSLKVKPSVFRKKSWFNVITDFLFLQVRRLCSVLFSIKLERDNHAELYSNCLRIAHIENDKEVYCFRRYGTWKDAHVEGIEKVINETSLKKIVDKESAIVFYTHLGKRKADLYNQEYIIPEKTKETFVLLKKYYEDKLINLSPLSLLLDYIVIKDNIEIDSKRNIINFKSDGIRYTLLTIGDLLEHSFSFVVSKGFKKELLTVMIDSRNVDSYYLNNDISGILTISFKTT